MSNEQIAEKLRDLSDNDFTGVMNRTSQERVIRIGLEVSTPEQQKSLARFGRTKEIVAMFTKKLLPADLL